MNIISTRIVIVGGGFGGAYTALHLQRLIGNDTSVEVTLVSTENFMLFTPMLHEVAAGGLDATDIVNPLRQMLPGIRLIQAEVKAIDLPAKQVVLATGPDRQVSSIPYDRLVIAAGSEDNFFGNKELAAGALPMKTLTDAMILRNRVIALLEHAEMEQDRERRRAMLTFVVAGGGFAGTEVVGALNDFVRGALEWYPAIAKDEIRLVLVHAGEVILPELGAELGRFAQSRLVARGVEVRYSTRVRGYSGNQVLVDTGDPIHAFSLVWTAGVSPGQIIADLAVAKENHRIKVNEFLELPDAPGVWALGDCAAATDSSTGRPFPTTAQHAIRQAKTVALNVMASLIGAPATPFRFKTVGQLAAIGRRNGVAQILGIRFSGFSAWFLWRSVYLMKLPGLQKKIRVALHWTIDLFFGHDLTQVITLNGVEKAHRMVERSRQVST